MATELPCRNCSVLVRFCDCCDRWIHVYSNSHYCEPASSGTTAAPEGEGL